jgi:hypothetical protein
MPIKHSSHTLINGSGAVHTGNPFGGPRNYTIPGTLQPATIRYGRAPTPRFRVPETQATASVTQHGFQGRVRNVRGERSK